MSTAATFRLATGPANPARPYRVWAPAGPSRRAYLVGDFESLHDAYRCLFDQVAQDDQPDAYVTYMDVDLP